MVNYQLDLTAYQCPMPLLMTKKALGQLPAKSRLILTLNKQSSVEDFQLFCLEKGYQLISVTQIESGFQLVIQG